VQALFPSRRLVADAPLLRREPAGLLQVVPKPVLSRESGYLQSRGPTGWSGGPERV